MEDGGGGNRALPTPANPTRLQIKGGVHIPDHGGYRNVPYFTYARTGRSPPFSFLGPMSIKHHPKNKRIGSAAAIGRLQTIERRKIHGRGFSGNGYAVGGIGRNAPACVHPRATQVRGKPKLALSTELC